MSKEVFDTQPDPAPPTDAEREAKLQAEADAIDRAIAYRRPPVDYQERAASNGEAGARYYAEHQPAKATEHTTDPDGRVILNTTPAPDAEIDPNTTLPMGPPKAKDAPRKNGTDPMWPPPSTQPVAISSEPRIPIAAGSSRPRLDRSLETTMDVAVPVPARPIFQLKVALVSAVCAAALLLIVIVVWNLASAPAESNVQAVPSPTVSSSTSPNAVIAPVASAPASARPSVNVPTTASSPATITPSSAATVAASSAQTVVPSAAPPIAPPAKTNGAVTAGSNQSDSRRNSPPSSTNAPSARPTVSARPPSAPTNDPPAPTAPAGFIQNM